MAVGNYSTDFRVVPGVRLSGIPCGIKGLNKLDLVLFEFVSGSVTAGVFTQSHFAAPPVLVSREHLLQSNSRYFLINSGNANAATGDEGKADALICCKAVSQRTGVRLDEVIPFQRVLVEGHFEWGCLHVHIHIRDGQQNRSEHKLRFEK